MSVLEENLKALSATHPELLDIGAAEPGGGVTVTQAPSGEPTAVCSGAYIHSRYDPRKEAAALIRGGRALGGDAPTAGILLGFGLGYAAEEFRRLYPSLPLLVVESDADIFRSALRCRDLRGILGSPLVRLLVGAKPEEVSSRLEELPLAGPLLLRIRSLVERNAAYFRPVEEIVHSFLLRRDININTLARFGRLWVRNLASNILPFLFSPGAGMLSGMFRGIPALLLAGGPSLDMVMPHLKELSRRFLVVSVDTPLFSCLSAGVKPDFVVMVDPQFWASRYLDWTDGYDGFIVAEPSAHPRTFRDRRRRVIMASSLFPLGTLLEEHAGEKGKLGAGGSVSTSAWDLCRLFGACPIHVSGMDLGFPGSRTHCSGAFFEQSWFSVCGRLSPAEGQAFSYLREIGVFPMPSNGGPPTLTDRRMLLYKWWFESQLAEAQTDHAPAGTTRAGLPASAAPDADAMQPASSFSLSPGAVAIRGMPLVGIEDALALPVVRPLIDERMERARAETDAFRADRRGAAAKLDTALAGLLDGLVELESLSQRGLSATRELERALRGGAAPERAAKRGTGSRMPLTPASILKELDEVDTRILELSSRNIVGFLMQGLIHRITGSSSRAAGRDAVLSASLQLYEEIGESARFHEKILSKAEKTLAQYYDERGRNNV